MSKIRRTSIPNLIDKLTVKTKARSPFSSKIQESNNDDSNGIMSSNVNKIQHTTNCLNNSPSTMFSSTITNSNVVPDERCVTINSDDDDDFVSRNDYTHVERNTLSSNHSDFDQEILRRYTNLMFDDIRNDSKLQNDNKQTIESVSTVDELNIHSLPNSSNTVISPTFQHEYESLPDLTYEQYQECDVLRKQSITTVQPNTMYSCHSTSSDLLYYGHNYPVDKSRVRAMVCGEYEEHDLRELTKHEFVEYCNHHHNSLFVKDDDLRIVTQSSRCNNEYGTFSFLFPKNVDYHTSSYSYDTYITMGRYATRIPGFIRRLLCDIMKEHSTKEDFIHYATNVNLRKYFKVTKSRITVLGKTVHYKDLEIHTLDEQEFVLEPCNILCGSSGGYLHMVREIFKLGVSSKEPLVIWDGIRFSMITPHDVSCISIPHIYNIVEPNETGISYVLLSFKLKAKSDSGALVPAQIREVDGKYILTWDVLDTSSCNQDRYTVSRTFSDIFIYGRGSHFTDRDTFIDPENGVIMLHKLKSVDKDDMRLIEYKIDEKLLRSLGKNNITRVDGQATHIIVLLRVSTSRYTSYYSTHEGIFDPNSNHKFAYQDSHRMFTLFESDPSVFDTILCDAEKRLLNVTTVRRDRQINTIQHIDNILADVSKEILSDEDRDHINYLSSSNKSKRYISYEDYRRILGGRDSDLSYLHTIFARCAYRKLKGTDSSTGTHFVPDGVITNTGYRSYCHRCCRMYNSILSTVCCNLIHIINRKAINRLPKNRHHVLYDITMSIPKQK